ncbi:MAG: coproporphyrinogen-III oxidase family protein [Verrucomicrobiae bacterium]|nr:coproporphyrinogen-III oxidase family protein [Verrucomicrobiae bacterium]
MTTSLPEWLAFVEKHAHDFTIQYPPRREYFMQNFQRTPAPGVGGWFSGVEELGLYLHVPFCEAKCFYCNFAVDVSSDERIHREYVDALLRELELHADWLAQRRIIGVDIGGGTPTRLLVSELTRIANAIRPLLSRTTHAFSTSIETTPRIAAEQPEKLAVLRAGGVQRVSLGVQSFNATTLASVNRRRQIEQTDQAMASLRAAGFPRINLDVIFALPGQSLSDWKRDLERIIALAPDSVTTYDCLYRGQGRTLTRRTPELPVPETYGAMYDLAHELLGSAGWRAPYGSVNFCRHPGETGTSAYFESRLLDGQPYLGLGNYATSLQGNHWGFNAQSTADYVARIAAGANPCEFSYELPAAESQAKYALFSLNYGFVDAARFAKRFGVSFPEFYARELSHALAVGWLEQRGECWHVKPGQFGRMHSIRSLFYPEPARRWLMSLNCP